jgi:N4-gp56 family major capsid protein
MQMYNNPAGGTPASIEGAGSSQMNTFFWQRRALIEAQKEMYFSPLADVTAMPKHYGKEIRLYHYMPLLDDRNVNDQGLNAAGAVIANGNLYGSSKDIGNITGKLPMLSETGGRVNRVGFTRLMLTGSLHKFGFFTEFTQEALDFDSDEDLYAHLSRELVTGATQLTEAVLQKDLLAAAGVIIYAGSATATNQITGEGASISEVTYEDLMRLSRILTDNRTPKQTKVITGSKMIDTKTINSGRVLYIGSELEATVKGMTDLFGNEAFIPVHKYANAGTILNGEIGTIDQFRIVVVPEMLHWAGAGANVTNNPGYMATSGKYDVFPMLVIGEGSFTTIGFQTGGKMMKFKITTKMPGNDTADRSDPYGETGFSSIKWYYGYMTLRSERIGLVKTVAKI